MGDSRHGSSRSPAGREPGARPACFRRLCARHYWWRMCQHPAAEPRVGHDAASNCRLGLCARRPAVSVGRSGSRSMRPDRRDILGRQRAVGGDGSGARDLAVAVGVVADLEHRSLVPTDEERFLITVTHARAPGHPLPATRPTKALPAADPARFVGGTALPRACAGSGRRRHHAQGRAEPRKLEALALRFNDCSLEIVRVGNRERLAAITRHRDGAGADRAEVALCAQPATINRAIGQPRSASARHPPSHGSAAHVHGVWQSGELSSPLIGAHGQPCRARARDHSSAGWRSEGSAFDGVAIQMVEGGARWPALSRRSSPAPTPASRTARPMRLGLRALLDMSPGVICRRGRSSANLARAWRVPARTRAVTMVQLPGTNGAPSAARSSRPGSHRPLAPPSRRRCRGSSASRPW